MVVIAAGTKRYDGAAEAVDRVTAQTPADAAARTMTATGSTMRGLEMRPRKREKRFLRRGAFWWAVAPAVLDEPPPPRAVRRRSMPVRSPARCWRPRLLPVPSFMPMYCLGGRPRSLDAMVFENHPDFSRSTRLIAWRRLEGGRPDLVRRSRHGHRQPGRVCVVRPTAQQALRA